MTLKDGYGFGGFSRAPPSKQHLSMYPPPPPGRGQYLLLNLLWKCEFRFKCSMSSLAVVFFVRPFFGGLLAFCIGETVCKPFTLFHSKWETKLRYQGQLNHPTPRMTKTLLCCILSHVPWAPLHPTIYPSLKRKIICYSLILFRIVCHLSMVTSQKHHYTNKPTSQYSFIIAYVAILMAREGTVIEGIEFIMPIAHISTTFVSKSLLTDRNIIAVMMRIRWK